MRAINLAPRNYGVAGAIARPAYSRFVGLMKWALPALALLLIVLVLAWPGVLKRKEGFQLSFTGLSGLGEEQLTMLNPRYLGVDRRNQPYVVTADSAHQDPSDPLLVTLDRVQADITLSDGSWVSLSASAGAYRQRVETLRLEGPVSIHSDRGYELRLRYADMALSEGRAWSEAPVEGQGPFGLLTADRMRLEDGGARIFFEGRVRMTIFPGARA